MGNCFKKNLIEPIDIRAYTSINRSNTFILDNEPINFYQFNKESSTVKDSSIWEFSFTNESSLTNFDSFTRKKIKIYISYCWQDKNLSHSLAKLLYKHGFNVLIDKDKLSLELSNSIEKSDLILICVSESYMKCIACQKEARLCFEQYIPILPILFNSSNYEPSLWIAQIIGGKNYKILIHESIKYPELSEIIFNRIEILCSKITNQIERKEKILVSTKEMSKLKKAYDSKLKETIEKEKKIIDETKDHIEKVFELKDDFESLILEVPCIYRWYSRYPNTTISNFPPFSPTGDINDAVFYLENDSIKILEQDKQVVSSVGRGSLRKFSHVKRNVNLCQISIDYDKMLSAKKTNSLDLTTLMFMKSLERHSRFDTALSNGKTAWSLIKNGDFNCQQPRSEQDMKRRKKLDSDLNIKKQRRISLSKYFQCEPNTFCKFAERMLQNIKEFERLCEPNLTIDEIKNPIESKNKLLFLNLKPEYFISYTLDIKKKSKN